MSNKRTIKKRKIRLTPLGKKVAGLTGAIMIGTSFIGIMAVKENAKADISTPPTLETIEEVETTESFEDIFVVNQEPLTPIINETTATETRAPIIIEPNLTSEETIEDANNDNYISVSTPTPTPIIDNNGAEETIETLSDSLSQIEEIDNIATNTPNFEVPVSSFNLTLGYASDRNYSDDVYKYNYVREHYGNIIDEVALETRWDPRIISALISQENPFAQPQASVYGITSIHGMHQGETYSYGYYDSNGEHQNRNITVDIERVSSDPRFAIEVQIAILQTYLEYTNVHDILVFGSYNGGPGTIYGNDTNEALNNFRWNVQLEHDAEYYAHIFYKLNALSDEGINNLYLTDLHGNTTSFDLTFVNEPDVISVSNINTHTL